MTISCPYLPPYVTFPQKGDYAKSPCNSLINKDFNCGPTPISQCSSGPSCLRSVSFDMVSRDPTTSKLRWTGGYSLRSIFFRCAPNRTPNLQIMSTLLSRRQMKNVGVKMVAEHIDTINSQCQLGVRISPTTFLF